MTMKFLPLLRSSADARIITVSSISHNLPPFPLEPIQFDTKESFNVTVPDGVGQCEVNTLPYAHSELVNILFASELQRKLDAEEGYCPISISLHPGSVNTQLLKDFREIQNAQHYLENAITALEGALTPLFAATASQVREEKKKFGGSYWMPFNVMSPDDLSEHAKNTKLAEDLWNITRGLFTYVDNL